MHAVPFQAASLHPLAAQRQARRCVVCDGTLHAGARPTAQADPYPSCETVACRMVVARRAAMDEAGFRHYLRAQAGLRVQLTAHTVATVARRAQEESTNAHAWHVLQRFAQVDSASDALRLVLPSGPRRARKLAAARRACYREHLTTVAAEAAALPPGAPSDGCDTELAAAQVNSSLPGRLCGQCAGGCCTRGGEQAYLSAQTLRRFMDTQPGMDAAAVVDAYLGRLERSTQAGSCINHTRAGCSLPRAMRSDICNSFACAPLARVLTAQQGGQPPRALLVVQRAQDHWRRADPTRDNDIVGAAVLDEAGARRLPQRQWRAE